jgi:hypothetical protein
MSLIWSSSGINGEGLSLATLATVRVEAEEALNATPAGHPQRLERLLQCDKARDRCDEASRQDHDWWAQHHHARTHAIVIGVGKYDTCSSQMQNVTTSVHGAYAFVEYLLGDFHHATRPLGSVELLISSNDELSRWKPSESAANRLNIPQGTAVRVERATYRNIEDAFNRWVKRANDHGDGALFYFSGHGAASYNRSYVIPEDGALEPPRNLIELETTIDGLRNSAPEVLCFFIDSCREKHNADSDVLGARLAYAGKDPNRNREASLFAGSAIGGQAYGLPDEAPFFTQELIACLKRRGAGANKWRNLWEVTTSSLRSALGYAGPRRSACEDQGVSLAFSAHIFDSTETGVICHFVAQPEVFVKVQCEPVDALATAWLSVTDSAGETHARGHPQSTVWHTLVPPGPCTGVAEFDAPSEYARGEETTVLAPPCAPLVINLQPASSEVAETGALP